MATRRQFIRNITFASIGLSIAPTVLSASGRSSKSVKAECNPTTLDYYGQGPFYKSGAPELTDGKLAASTEPGKKLVISGIVRTLDCEKVIPDAIIDIWHANEKGEYDNSGYNLRGVVKSNSQGFFLFETIYPGKYLNGSKYRPSHIHFRITCPGESPYITQLYFEGDSDITGDAAASINQGTYDASNRIIPLTQNTEGAYEGTWDIIVDGTGVTGINEMHLDKGMIYNSSPNPFTDYVEVNYGIFKRSKVNIQIFDLNGKLIGILDEKIVEPQKYTVHWNAGHEIPKGYYFIALKINDLQVHYQKVQKI